MLLELLAFATLTSAHSWAEQLQAIFPSGTYKGSPGYIRSFTGRDAPDVSDARNVFLQPPNDAGRTRINAQDPACAPQQQKPTYTETFPMLQAAPGDYFAVKYLEDGHVTQPDLLPGKPKGGGTVFVFMMEELQTGATLQEILRLPADGSLETGRLLVTGNFDDERCYQINANAALSLSRQKEFPNPAAGQEGGVNTERWCELDAQIPADAPARGTLSGIWVWAWPTEGEGAKDEYYTSCFDIAMGRGRGAAAAGGNGTGVPLAVQDPNVEAVEGFRSRKADQPSAEFYLGSAEAG